MAFSLVIIPISIPRKLASLRYASMFSIMLSIYVVFVIIIECAIGRGTSTSVSEGFHAGADRSNINVSGIFNSLPIIIFSYMY